jgi:hypothetical protein
MSLTATNSHNPGTHHASRWPPDDQRRSCLGSRKTESTRGPLGIRCDEPAVSSRNCCFLACGEGLTESYRYFAVRCSQCIPHYISQEH